MNKERILQLADIIEAAGKAGNKAAIRYDQGTWGGAQDIYGFPAKLADADAKECGTECCIAGFWATHSGTKRGWNSYFLGDSLSFRAFRLGRVIKELGLTDEQAIELFDGRVDASDCYKGPGWRVAVKVLRNFAETGEVNWPKKWEREYLIDTYEIACAHAKEAELRREREEA